MEFGIIFQLISRAAARMVPPRVRRAGEQTCYIKTLPTFLRFSDLRKLEFSRVGFSGAGMAGTPAPAFDWLLSEPEPGCDGSESPGYAGEFCSQDRRELETGDYCCISPRHLDTSDICLGNCSASVLLASGSQQTLLRLRISNPGLPPLNIQHLPRIIFIGKRGALLYDIGFILCSLLQ